MTLILEDGTGLATANSMAAVADADTYWAARGNTVWGTQLDATKQAALVRAADFLRNEQRFPYRGVKASYTQTMPWPRTGAQELHGPVVPNNVVPWRLRDAQCELALRALTADVQPDLERGGLIQTQTVDVLTTTWAANAPGETLYPAVMGLLAPLLRTIQALAVPYITSPDQTAADGPFQPDIFDNTAAALPVIYPGE